MKFREIDPLIERKRIITFFIESANGEESGEVSDSFDEDEYIAFAKQKADELPDGFVFAEKEGKTVGELVLRIMPHDGQSIGYVSFIYVLPEYRGKGYSQQMFTYMEELCQRHGVFECHLRVSQTNHRAIRFYEKQGFSVLGEELNKLKQICWRMGKVIHSNNK